MLGGPAGGHLLPHSNLDSHHTNTHVSPHSPNRDNIISAKLKLDELFLKWVSQGDTLQYIRHLIHEIKHPDISLKKGPFAHSQTASLPGSPPSARRSSGSNSSAASPSPSKLRSLDEDSFPDARGKHDETVERDRKIPRVEVSIPPFYVPKVAPPQFISPSDVEGDIQKIRKAFSPYSLNEASEARSMPYPEVELLLKHLWDDLPRILYRLMYINIVNTSKSREMNEESFLRFYKSTLAVAPDSETVLVHTLRQTARDYLIPGDFRPFARILLDTHPGLEFLKSTPEFQERYAETIIVRIFFNLSHRRKGRIAAADMQRARFMEALAVLDLEPDINKHLEYFSYEHFYVIYCKFWEIDTDHDLVISALDLCRYGNGMLTQRMIDRVVACVMLPRDSEGVRLLGGPKAIQSLPPRMTYQDFVYFMLAEEDKCSIAAQKFWFECLDLDSDDVLSLYELEHFYQEQQDRMQAIPMESPPFVDILCQMLDMIKPDRTTRGASRVVREGRGPAMGVGSVLNTLSAGIEPGTANGAPLVTFADIRRQDPKLVGYFFNALFNLSKFIAFETKDPFQMPDGEGGDIAPGLGNPDTDWCRFAEVEYDRAVTEENNDTSSPRDADMYY